MRVALSPPLALGLFHYIPVGRFHHYIPVKRNKHIATSSPMM